MNRILLSITAGACFGSFGCCLFERISCHETLAGRSRCDSCGHLLGWQDLIPVVSYILCQGRCRWCGGRIGAAKLVWELAGAVIGLVLAVGMRW